MTLRALSPCVPLFAVMASPAGAELPAPVRAMIEAAIATGDASKVSTVVQLAKQTNPDDIEEIDALQSAFQAAQRELAAAERARKEQEIRTAGVFDNWKGRGQLGGFHTSGNTENTGATLSLALNRSGIDWEHRLRAKADFQRSGGKTSREQLHVSYEYRFHVKCVLLTYSLCHMERVRSQALYARYVYAGV